MNGPFQNHERDVRTSPRLRPSTDCDPEGRQKCDVLQTMRDVCESEVEMKLNKRTVLASTGKRPVEIGRPCCPHGHGSDEIPCL